MNDKVIGILGGMGPEATANLFIKIINATKVTTDQDHFHVIIDSNAKIPDRTKFIFGIGESPVKAMICTGKNLERIGVDIGCIPCITAHHFIEEVQRELSYPLINSLEELNNHIKFNFPGTKKIGILATSGTIKTGLFEKYLSKLEILYPDKVTQEKQVMEAIYGNKGIKGGNKGEYPLELLKNASVELIQNGAEIIVSGCTEVALVLTDKDVEKPMLDPMDIVVNTLVK